MTGELDGENTSDISLTHCCNRGIVSDGQGAVEGAKKYTVFTSLIGRSLPVAEGRRRRILLKKSDFQLT
jgi:hypothetical protein